MVVNYVKKVNYMENVMLNVRKIVMVWSVCATVGFPLISSASDATRLLDLDVSCRQKNCMLLENGKDYKIRVKEVVQYVEVRGKDTLSQRQYLNVLSTEGHWYALSFWALPIVLSSMDSSEEISFQCVETSPQYWDILARRFCMVSKRAVGVKRVGGAM